MSYLTDWFSLAQAEEKEKKEEKKEELEGLAEEEEEPEERVEEGPVGSPKTALSRYGLRVAIGGILFILLLLFLYFGLKRRKAIDSSRKMS